MRIGLIYKEEDQLIAGTAEKLVAEFRKAGHQVEVLNSLHPPRHSQFVIAMGGDGTALRAARLVSFRGIPILPVFMGGLGLLTEISPLELAQSLELVRAKKYHLDRRMMIEVSVLRSGKKLKSTVALNDAVIGKSSIARTIRLEAFLKDKSIAEYVGDGLIISTPTGSTAYNFAVNGPILPLHSRSFILSPICPHRAANRSIVLEEPVRIRTLKGDDNLLTIDGQETFKLKKEDEVLVRRSKMTTDFIRLKEYDLWEILRKKLGWG